MVNHKGAGKTKNWPQVRGQWRTKLFMGTTYKNMLATPCSIATKTSEISVKKTCNLDTNLHNAFILS